MNQIDRDIRNLFFTESHRGTNWAGLHTPPQPKNTETKEQKERRIADLMKRAKRK